MKLRLIVAIVIELASLRLVAQDITNYTSVDGLINNTVNCLAVDDQDNLWFGTDAGISFFDTNADSWVSLNVAQGTGLIDDRITAIYVSPFTGLWVGTDFGISHWDGSVFSSYTDADGIGDNRIQWITEAESGELYFGTKNGFTVWDEGEWSTYGMEEGIPFGGVKSISVIDNDVVVLGLGLEGVGIYDLVDTTMIILNESDGLLSDKVKSVYFDYVTEDIWSATDNGMNRLYEDENNEAVIESHPSVFELPPPHEVNQLTDVKIDTLGVVWAGVWIEYLTDVGGVSYYDGVSWTSIGVDDGLVGPVVYQLAVDGHNCVWVATSTGVSRICPSVSSTINYSQDVFEVFPNPVNSSLTVNFHSILENNMKVEILNSELRMIHNFSPSKSSKMVKLDLSNLTAGIYFIRIGNGIQRIVKL